MTKSLNTDEIDFLNQKGILVEQIDYDI